MALFCTDAAADQCGSVYTEGTRHPLFNGYTRENQVVLEIRDEGIGIPQSDLPRVFDPYFTGENGRRFQESTGMGLFLVKQICDKLGHAFEIESKVDEGTTVRIIFMDSSGHIAQ